MPYEFLTTTRSHSVEYLTLNRPERRNAFDDRLVAELSRWAATAQEAAGRGELRIVVLAGAGKAFCAGADATWMASTIRHTEAENLRDATAMAHMYRAIDELPVP